MRQSASVLLLLLLSASLFAQNGGPVAQPSPPPAPKQISPRILAAKTVFFDDQSGAPPVGKAALAELKKWNRFQLVSNTSQADLIFQLSASPPRGGHIVYSGGQTGTVENGKVEPDSVPTYHKSSPVRAAYLSVFDARSGELLWADSRNWGGLLTGYDSAGRRLVSKLRKQTEK